MKESRLLRAIELVETETVTKTLTIGELTGLLGELGNGILIILFCLVFLQPIPLPGASTPIGIVVAYLATLQYFRKAPQIPRRFHHHVIPQKALHKVAEVARRLWSKIERFLKPRFLFLTGSKLCRFINWWIIVILLIAFAQLEEDGVLIIASYVMMTVMGIFFFSIRAGLWSFAQRP